VKELVGLKRILLGHGLYVSPSSQVLCLLMALFGKKGTLGDRIRLQKKMR
jgi:hypothetical protein